MKTISVLFNIVILFSQALSVNAWADAICEQKHKVALMELTQLVRRHPDTELANLLLNGKNSGIDIYTASDEQLKKLAKSMRSIAMDMQKIMNEPHCTSENRKIEKFKKAIKPTDHPHTQFALDFAIGAINKIPAIPDIPNEPANFEHGVRVLSSLGGLQGLSVDLDKTILAQQQTTVDDTQADTTQDSGPITVIEE